MDPRMMGWLDVNTETPEETQRLADVYSRLQGAPSGGQGFDNPGGQLDLDPEFLKQLLEKIRQLQGMQGMGGAGSMGAGAGQLNQLGQELNNY